MKVVPFPLAECQAAVFARVWANELPLPPPAQMRRWEDEEAERRGDRRMHVFPKGGDADYINALHDWIRESGAPGKVPPRWGDELLWQRQIYADAKLRFEIEGRTARSLEELGFEYTPKPGPADAPETL
jgi:hypothetical protein